jgi:hypothetical protein
MDLGRESRPPVTPLDPDARDCLDEEREEDAEGWSERMAI